MHRIKITIVIALSFMSAFLLIWNFAPQAGASKGSGKASSASASFKGDEEGSDPDLPAKSFLRDRIDKS